MIRKILSSQLGINMASGVVTAVVDTVVLAIAYPVFLHFLGYETYGVWLVLATVLTFAQLGDLGISQAVTKLVAEGYGRGDIEGIQRYVTTALVMLCLSGTVALAVILVLRNPIVAAFKLSSENAKTVSWLLPYICILSIYVFIVQALSATLSGMGRMDLVSYIQSIGRMLSIVAVTILLYSSFGIESLLIGSTISYVFIHVASLLCIRRIADIRFLQTGNLDVQRGKHILRFGGTLFSGSLMSMFVGPFNKLMLSRYAGVSTIPVYDIAFTASMQIRCLIEAGIRPLMPEVSRIGANMTVEAKNRISQINSRVMKLIFIFGVPFYGILAIFSPLLLRIWLRDRFVETLPGAFQIMLVATFFTLLGVPAYYTIIGLGKLRSFITATIIGTVGNFILVTSYYVLMRHLSVYGVGLCLVISFAVSTAYLICKARH